MPLKTEIQTRISEIITSYAAFALTNKKTPSLKNDSATCFGEPGPFQALFSRFGQRAWRWSFPYQTFFKQFCSTCSGEPVPFQATFSKFGLLAWRWSFLVSFLFNVPLESATKNILSSLAEPFSSSFSRFGRRADGHFLLNFLFQNATKPILTSLGASGLILILGQRAWRWSFQTSFSYKRWCTTCFGEAGPFQTLF